MGCCHIGHASNCRHVHLRVGCCYSCHLCNSYNSRQYGHFRASYYPQSLLHCKMRLAILRVLLADPRARSRHHMILRSPGNLHHRDYWSETWSGLGQLAYVGPPRLPQGIQESVRFLDLAGWCPRSQGLSVPSGHKPVTCSGEEDDSFRQTPTIS